MTTYHLKTIADLLKVPIERRDECLKELGLALAVHDLAFGEDAPDAPVLVFDWTDDGDASCELTDEQGEQILKLQITKDGQAWANDRATHEVQYGSNN